MLFFVFVWISLASKIIPDLIEIWMLQSLCCCNSLRMVYNRQLLNQIYGLRVVIFIGNKTSSFIADQILPVSTCHSVLLNVLIDFL